MDANTVFWSIILVFLLFTQAGRFIAAFGLVVLLVVVSCANVAQADDGTVLSKTYGNGTELERDTLCYMVTTWDGKYSDLSESARRTNEINREWFLFAIALAAATEFGDELSDDDLQSFRDSFELYIETLVSDLKPDGLTPADSAELTWLRGTCLLRVTST